MSSGDANDFKKYQWVFNLGGAYLGFCLVLHFLYSPQQMYNDVIGKCGRVSQFCECQAQATVDQRNFLTYPLTITGLFPIRNVSALCSKYL